MNSGTRYYYYAWLIIQTSNLILQQPNCKSEALPTELYPEPSALSMKLDRSYKNYIFVNTKASITSRLIV